MLTIISKGDITPFSSYYMAGISDFVLRWLELSNFPKMDKIRYIEFHTNALKTVNIALCNFYNFCTTRLFLIVHVSYFLHHVSTARLSSLSATILWHNVFTTSLNAKSFRFQIHQRKQLEGFQSRFSFSF